MVECELARIIIDEHRDEQAIFLREIGGGRTFPILIGIFEATVIDRVVKECRVERSFIHEFLLDVIQKFGGRLTAVRIEELARGVFFAKIVIESQGRETLIDARPSDAVALALQARAPILVAEEVLDKVGKPG